MKVKVNNEALAKTLGVSPGAIVNVDCKGGVPVGREWRNRLKDAEIDGCISVVEDEKPSKSRKGGAD